MHPSERVIGNDNAETNYREYIKELVSSDLPVNSGIDGFTDEELDILNRIPTDKMMLMKVVLIGDGAVGKTSIRHQYLGKGFKESYLVTIGADFTASPTFDFGSGSLRFQIWDLAGQPSFAAVRGSYYTAAAGGLIVFDVTNPASFNNISDWIHELWQCNGKGPIPLLILGNKTDLRDSSRRVAIEDAAAREFALKISNQTSKKYGVKVSYLPTSAKTGLNIEEAFNQLALSVLLQNAFAGGFK